MLISIPKIIACNIATDCSIVQSRHTFKILVTPIPGPFCHRIGIFFLGEGSFCFGFRFFHFWEMRQGLMCCPENNFVFQASKRSVVAWGVTAHDDYYSNTYLPKVTPVFSSSTCMRSCLA